MLALGYHGEVRWGNPCVTLATASLGRGVPVLGISFPLPTRGR